MTPQESQEQRYVGGYGSQGSGVAEVTLPGAGDGLEARITNAELRSIRFLITIAAVTVLILGLVGGLGFQLLKHVLKGEGIGSTSECVEGDNSCAEGQVCEFGVCTDRIDSNVYCQVGDVCNSGCAPGSELSCGPNNMYIAANSASDVICDDPRVAEFLQSIAKKCVSLKSCKGDDFRDFAIAREDFVSLMTTFPGTVALHFPSGKPAIEGDGGEWPDPPSKAHYVERLRPMVPAFRSAQTILLVALSSAGEPRKQSDARAYMRAKVAEQLVVAAGTAAGLDAAGLDVLEAKLKSVQLGDRKPISPRTYAKDMLLRSITWNRDNDAHLRSLLELNVPTTSQTRYRNALVNQTVFVVPIPCSLAGAA